MATNRRPKIAAANYGLVRRMWSHRLLHRMLARQEIDLTANTWSGAEATILRALHCCVQCPVKEECRAWLAGEAPAASYARFCPNAERIEVLRITGA